ncbi:hypothetical protein N7488_000878 [Penicillium malachiteum]|nr:hypothetical protein N7488_000878 [Penicillium malachiteum]
MGATARPQNTGVPGAKKPQPRTSYSGVLKSGATKTESISKTELEEKTTTKPKKKKAKGTKKKPKDKTESEKPKDEDKAPGIELPFRPREPWKSPVIEVTEITDDMSDVPMPDIAPGESSDDDNYGIGPDPREEVDASLYYKLIEEDEKIHPE